MKSEILFFAFSHIADRSSLTIPFLNAFPTEIPAKSSMVEVEATSRSNANPHSPRRALSTVTNKQELNLHNKLASVKVYKANINVPDRVAVSSLSATVSTSLYHVEDAPPPPPPPPLTVLPESPHSLYSHHSHSSHRPHSNHSPRSHGGRSVSPRISPKSASHGAGGGPFDHDIG